MEAAGDEERALLHHPPPRLYQDGDSRYTCDGTVDVNGQPAAKASTGNWRACFFILGIEFSECLAYFAISKNLVTYLTSVLHESNVDAARNVSTWIGTTLFTLLVGAFLADTYWGRYKTMVIFLSVYTIGMLVLTISTALTWLLQSSNLGGIHRFAVYARLYLRALGNGGIKPCTSTFGADQFDIADPAERVKKGSFFNWYYFSINIGSLLSTTMIVWVQDNVGWGIGFAAPMVLMDVGFAVFVAGRRLYRGKKVHHTTQFRFLDKAAIAPSSPPEKKCAAASPWRLCTVPQVEEVKKLLRLCPVWASMVVFFMITSQMSSTLIEQGMAMDNRVGSFAVPPASLSGFYVITMLVLIPVYDAALVPMARHITGEYRGLKQMQRIGIGFALSVLAMAYSALLERSRLAAAADEEVVSIVWQAPAYAMLGGGEVFAVIGMLELFYDRAPGDMRSGELPQLCRAGRCGMGWVDSGGPQRRAPRLLLLGDGGAGRHEPAAVLVVLQSGHEVQR